MDQIVADLAEALRNAILKISPPGKAERPSTKAIYEALKAARPVLSKRFGGPMKCRYAGCSPITKSSCSQKPRKALEYLWDFSFSRFAIPQTIEQRGNAPLSGGKYELLLVVESELGTADEICRDLLKLLEARAAIRCLVYRQPKRLQQCQRLQSRMIRVLHNHAHFEPRSEAWLFIGLTWVPGHIDCDVYTLNDDGTAFSLSGCSKTA